VWESTYLEMSLTGMRRKLKRCHKIIIRGEINENRLNWAHCTVQTSSKNQLRFAQNWLASMNKLFFDAYLRLKFKIIFHLEEYNFTVALSHPDMLHRSNDVVCPYSQGYFIALTKLLRHMTKSKWFFHVDFEKFLK